MSVDRQSEGRGRGTEELGQLLRSLDDLDAEYAAGELADEDYEVLRDRYTVQAADAYRRVNPGAKQRSGPSAKAEAASGRSARSTSRLIVFAAIALFAVGAGWLLARSTGERGVFDALTGAIDESSRQRVARCQELATTEGELVAALECFDDVLADEPDNVEALAYRGWYLVLVGGAESGPEAADRQDLFDSAEVFLDRAVDVDPNYPDARAFRAVLSERQGKSAEVCADIEALLTLDPPPFFVRQTAPLAERNSC